MADRQRMDNRSFLAWLTLALIAASLWVFKSYLHYLVVAAVLALATSHIFEALTQRFARTKRDGFLYRWHPFLAAFLLTSLFLLLIFGPLIYFVVMTYEQISGLDLERIRATLVDVIDKSISVASQYTFLDEPLARLKEEGLSFVTGPAMKVGFEGMTGMVAGVSGLLGQIVWIMLFYFLFNAYGRQILTFLAELFPMEYEHEIYLYRECTGTVAVVFYSTLFNMLAQGLAFGILMAFVGGYDAVYLGILAGFCSVIPIVGAALVYVPVAVLELLAGHIANVVIILLFAWVIMGFVIDNVLRMVFIGYLKKKLGFEYRMNEILVLMAILAGISSFGFWGLIIGPSVLALTLAAANLYSHGLSKDAGQSERLSQSGVDT